MNYKETLNYLFTRLPMFQRIGPAAYKADLKNTIAICKLLNNPEKKFKSIHIAGTNGKGSSSHMLAAILQQCGYKTGLYTSPHLIDFRERIRINGKMISKKYVQQFVQQYKNEFDSINPSFFEWSVGLAFDYFANEKVDVAIIETGLGGRLDSTNVIRPIVSLITNIGYDHVNLLGDTLEKIAFEKAGIIKKNTPTVISEINPITENVFRSKAKKENSKIFFSAEEYIPYLHRLNDKGSEISVLKKSKSDFTTYEMDLQGSYQKKNLAGVLMTIDILRKKRFKINDDSIKTALKSVKKTTGLRGRFDKIREKPLVIADTGHNAEGISEVFDLLLKIKHEKLHIILGLVEDKDPKKILMQLPKKNVMYYFTKSSVPRSMDSVQLKKIAKTYSLNGKSFPDVQTAYNSAVKSAKQEDMIFVGGSTFVVADLLSLIKIK